MSMKIGRYEIITEIGRGSMGVVYKAHDPNLDLTVALKVLRQDRLSSEAFVKRFLSEAKALGRLDHPNIIRVYNVDEAEGTVYIAMEFIEGESLNDVMQKKRFGMEEIIGIGAVVADTLDYAHKQGIIHRDIKPSNILIRNDGRLKITDFGIAHIEDSAAPKQTQAGEILGTPAYMSPEQVLSRPVDGRSDIFSLGVILYELCAGNMPFPGQNLASIFNAITQLEPAPLREGNPEMPDNLSTVILKCLQKNPDNRFGSGGDLARALKGSVSKEEPVKAETPQQQKSPKGKSLIVAAVVIIAVVAGLAAYFILGTKKGTAPEVDKALQAVLKVESTPAGAQVFIDGNFKGKSPAVIELPAGKHEVRLTLTGHYDWEAQVQLQEKEETPLSVMLIAEPSGSETAIPQSREKDISEAPSARTASSGTGGNNISKIVDTAPAPVAEGAREAGTAGTKSADNELEDLIRDIKYK
ncbi:MAG: serine/threonine-protein kinase [Nitrospirota bacterium]